MTKTHTGLVVLIAFLAGLLGAWVFTAKKTDHEGVVIAASIKESAYDRVMRTKTFRCGYVVHPPHVIKLSGSDKPSGVVVDVMNETGRLLDIKIDWAEELGWGTTVEAMRSGRVDGICTDFFVNPIEGRFVNYSIPFYYEAMGVYVRADDHRFDANLQTLNDPAVSFSASDGGLNYFIVTQDFPKAPIHSLPNMTGLGTNLLDVATGKADATISTTLDGVTFDRFNKGKLRNLTLETPIRAYAATIALPQGDDALKTMIDSALIQLLYGQFVNQTLDKYNLPPEGIYRVARPYALPRS